MFTGIVEEIGIVEQITPMSDGVRLEIRGRRVLDDLKIEDSIAVDGVCQTVVGCTDHSFTVEAVGETLQKTTLPFFKPGRMVNLERSLTLNTRLGGHLVQGHVNGIGLVSRFHSRGENYFLEIQLPADLQKYCIREGSIAVDGISLTIATLTETKIGINIIPYTVENTTLKERKAADRVNIEVDVLARYIEQLLHRKAPGGLSLNDLKKWGY